VVKALRQLVAVRPAVLSMGHTTPSSRSLAACPVGGLAARLRGVVRLDVVAQDDREGASRALWFFSCLIEFAQQLRSGGARLGGRGEDHDGRIEPALADQAVNVPFLLPVALNGGKAPGNSWPTCGPDLAGASAHHEAGVRMSQAARRIGGGAWFLPSRDGWVASLGWPLT